MKIDEIEIVTACINKERRAQNLLFHKYSKKMMGVCFRYSRNREDAEDILNEGFMRVFEKLHTFNATGSLEGWIRKVIVNVAIARFNTGKKLYRFVDVNSIQISDHNSNDIYDALSAKELIQQIQKLPPAYQMVFNLYVFEGLKHKEIAKQLNISEGTSKSNLFDARTLLKKRIQELSVERKAI